MILDSIWCYTNSQFDIYVQEREESNSTRKELEGDLELLRQQQEDRMKVGAEWWNEWVEVFRHKYLLQLILRGWLLQTSYKIVTVLQ